MKIPWQRLHTPGAVAGDNATEENEGDTLVMKEIVPMGEVKSGRDSAEAGHASTSRPASGGHLGSASFSVWASKPKSGSGETGRPTGRVASSRRLRRGEAESPYRRCRPMKDGRRWTRLPLCGLNGSKQA